MVTTVEILRRTGIKGSLTLRRWHQHGLIPKPEIRTHPNGRGKTSYWPDWMIDRCARIKRLTDNGCSLDEAKETLGTDWATEEARSMRRYKFKEISEKLDRENGLNNLEDLVWHKLASSLRSWRNERTMAKALHIVLRDHVDKVLEIVGEGHGPVLILDGAQMAVTTDFMVSVFLAGRPAGSAPVVVVPLHREVYLSFSESTKKLPRVPTVKPVARVRIEAGGKTKEQAFRPVGQTDFEMILET
jgi:DNA-binding transcriptional MerR regulator